MGQPQCLTLSGSLTSTLPVTDLVHRALTCSEGNFCFTGEALRVPRDKAILPGSQIGQLQTSAVPLLFLWLRLPEAVLLQRPGVGRAGICIQ